MSRLKHPMNQISRFQNIASLYSKKPVCQKVMSLVQTFSELMIEKLGPTANEDRLFPNYQTTVWFFSIKLKFLSEWAKSHYLPEWSIAPIEVGMSTNTIWWIYLENDFFFSLQRKHWYMTWHTLTPIMRFTESLT